MIAMTKRSAVDVNPKPKNLTVNFEGACADLIASRIAPRFLTLVRYDVGSAIFLAFILK